MIFKKEEILADYNFKGKLWDKDNNYIGEYELYSKTIALFPTELNKFKKELPQFNISNLYSSYYIVGFNKK